VVSAKQAPAAESALRSKAIECEAPLQFVNTPWNNRLTNLPGTYQQENAALAIAAIRASGIVVDERAIAEGLENVTWPARFQRYDEQLVIDGAHNPAGARILARTWREVLGDVRAVIILATLRDKDAAGVVAALAPIAARFLLPQAQTERALPPRELARVISTVAPRLAVSSLPSLAAALADARNCALPILITGSLHFAGEALALLNGESEQFEDCLQ
jgi:dihydrofolate synthase/folylpolyglutamate synthase